MTKFAVLVFVAAFLVLIVGCSAGIGSEEVQSEEQTKGQQIEEATKELLGGEIPAEDYRD